MTGDVVIRAEALGKKYLIKHEVERERYTALRDEIARKVRSIGRSGMDLLSRRAVPPGNSVEEFWALKDVSFELRSGEVLGVIGRNGAGKSTLLKVLSRITEPSEGRVTIRGRVASLLEVGTGFHPELTGRENIYLNGAILGMTRAEIRRKFDEIVAFAEVERFLDTPVKRYSSGMYVRLAFAVAAHLEPDILLVDEVLAVGDAQFQKKSVSKLKQISKTGQTVLFVSHNLSAIGTLCNIGLYLQRGQVMRIGPVHEILAEYSQNAGAVGKYERALPVMSDATLVIASAVYDPGNMVDLPRVSLNLTIIGRRDMTISIGIQLKDALGMPIAYAALGALQPLEVVPLKKGTNQLGIEIPAETLAAGSYTISIDLANPNVVYYDRAEDCLSIDVEPITMLGNSRPLQQAWGFGSILLHPKIVYNKPLTTA